MRFGVRGSSCLLYPGMTDERFASIFEQSSLASLSVEAMLFLRVGEEEQKCVACVTPVAVGITS